MSEEQKKQPSPSTDAGAPRTRRPYARPELVEYGSIARLTHTGGSTTTEAGVPKKSKKTCL